jgi:hypothetical protein
MKSMKLSDKDREGTAPKAALVNESDFPYGLMLHLGEPELKKLGLVGLPKAGSGLEVHGKAKVTHVSMHDGGDGKQRSMGIQITHLELGDEKDEKNAEDLLYGKGDK